MPGWTPSTYGRPQSAAREPSPRDALPKVKARITFWDRGLGLWSRDLSDSGPYPVVHNMMAGLFHNSDESIGGRCEKVDHRSICITEACLEVSKDNFRLIIDGCRKRRRPSCRSDQKAQRPRPRRPSSWLEHMGRLVRLAPMVIMMTKPPPQAHPCHFLFRTTPAAKRVL